MLALDHPLNFIEYLDCTFIVGDKQGLQDCFKIINSLYPSAGLKGPVASKSVRVAVASASKCLAQKFPKECPVTSR
jgi:hypothetical protein